MEKRDKFTGMNSIKFNRYFKTEEDCLKYISDIKWEHGYVCRNCGNTKYIKGSNLTIGDASNAKKMKARLREPCSTR